MAGQLANEFRHSGIGWTTAPAYLAGQFGKRLWRINHGARLKRKVPRAETGADLSFAQAIRGGDDDQRSLTILLDPLLHLPQNDYDHYADREPGDPQVDLAAPKAQPDDGDEPKAGGRGDAEHQVVAANDRTASDETHARQNAKGQAHEVQGDERIRRFSSCAQQRVGLDHRNTRGQRHQHGGPQPGRASVFASVKTYYKAGHGRPQQT